MTDSANFPAEALRDRAHFDSGKLRMQRAIERIRASDDPFEGEAILLDAIIEADGGMKIAGAAQALVEAIR